MSSPFIAEVVLFAGNFAPRGWAFCDGQLLPISSNSALFSLVGTTYGGDGRVTLALPDLRGRAAIGPRRGPGLSNYQLGQRGGTETTTLLTQNLPSHNHSVKVKIADGIGDSAAAHGNSLGKFAVEDQTSQTVEVYNTANEFTEGNFLGGVTSNNVGNSIAFSNLQPFLAINYIIALVGVYPSRN